MTEDQKLISVEETDKKTWFDGLKYKDMGFRNCMNGNEGKT